MAKISNESGRGFVCLVCDFSASSRHKAFCHVESKHFKDRPVIYPCPHCDKLLTSKNGLGVHISKLHRHQAVSFF